MAGLENIGFYTLSDERAEHASSKSPLSRCELILNSACNFRCPYCRGLRRDVQGNMPFSEASRVVSAWADDGLKNIRFSGGEPTLHPHLPALVQLAHDRKVRRIALSTNGSAKTDFYEWLIHLGLNDISISLDACCAGTGDVMAGVPGQWDVVVKNIEALSKKTYVTVGMVFTDTNMPEIQKAISFAHSLGVADIRIIPAAQMGRDLTTDLPEDVRRIADSHPILKYRLGNIQARRAMRGLEDTDSHKCPLVLDDMVVGGNKHFPCIIYLREGGDPIGDFGPEVREQRREWFEKHDCHSDPICRHQCLDVCVDYNNTWMRHSADQASLTRMDSSLFTASVWRAACDFMTEFGFPCRKDEMIKNRSMLQRFAIGWCHSENLACRPKANHVAVMYCKDDRDFWIHMRRSEFYEVFKLD